MKIDVTPFYGELYRDFMQGNRAVQDKIAWHFNLIKKRVWWSHSKWVDQHTRYLILIEPNEVTNLMTRRHEISGYNETFECKNITVRTP